MDDTQQNHQQSLENARLQDQERRQPDSNKTINPDSKKGIAKRMLTPTGFFAALKQASLLKDMPFVCACGFAILKDLLDFVTFETVILPIVFSILCSIFIFMMLMLAHATEKRKTANRFITRFFVIAGGGLLDSLPGIDFLPIETITVFIIYIMVLFERANMERLEKENAKNN
jgi:hypothetical protein